MQTAFALRKFSINSIAASFVVALAMTAGGAGGYWLKSQGSSAVTQMAQPPVVGRSRAVAPGDVSGQAINVTDAVDRAVARASIAGRP
jgi:hypothetical protein